MGRGVRHLSRPSSFPLPDMAGLAGSLHRGKEQTRANAYQALQWTQAHGQPCHALAAFSSPQRLSHVAIVTVGNGHI